MKNLKVEYRSLDELIPYANNARTHSDAQIAQIVASIAEFGFVNPVLVDGDGVLIAGHGRLMAARQLGMEKVPSIQLEHLSEAQRKALIIADNRIAMNAGWDEELLKLELETLDDLDFDLELLGFDPAEIDDLLFTEEEAEEAEETIPEVPEEPVSKPGDVWICGNHRVLCGDATVFDDTEKLMDGQLADMVFTDPPYNVDYGNTAKDKQRKAKGKSGGRTIMNDNLGEAFEQFLYDAITNMLMVTKGSLPLCQDSCRIYC